MKTKLLIIGAAVIVAGAATIGTISWLATRTKTQRSPKLEAALGQLFKQQGIGSPFRAVRESSWLKQKLVIQFSPSDDVKQRHGKKEMLLLPLALAGHCVKKADPGLDAVEIRSVNKDENAVKMSLKCADIEAFFNKDIGVENLTDRASFEVVPWEPAATDPTEKAQQYLERGRMFANEKGDFERALACFEQANALRPGNLDTLFALGMTQQALGHGAAAIDYLEAARQAKPDSIRVHAALARCYIANKQGNDAVAALRQFVTLRRTTGRSDPFYEPALYQAAEALFALKSYRDAEALLREVLQISPQHGHAWALLGKTQYQQKKKKEALASLRKAAELKPQDAQLLLQIGMYLSELKDYQAAAVAYRASYTLGNRDAGLFVGLSKAYQSSGRYFDAKHVVAEGFRYHLNDPDLESVLRASHKVIVKKRLRPTGAPAPIELTAR